MYTFFLPSPPGPIKNRTRARDPPRYWGLIRANHKKQKHLHPCPFSVTIRTMPLPPSPDSPAPDFIGTGRIYYPIPYATRLAPCGAFGLGEISAKLKGLTIDVCFKNGVAKETEMTVNYSWQEDDTRVFSEMDLNEWQKLPPVPPI